MKRFADGLDHPRWLYVLPNGDVLVAESNAPPKETTGVKNFVMKQVQKVAGAGTQSANRITLLRDADGDGLAETRSTFLENLILALRHVAGRQRSVCRQCRLGDALCLSDWRVSNHRCGHQACRPAGRTDQPPLDQEPGRQCRRLEALCRGRLQQQHRRERHGGRSRPGDGLEIDRADAVSARVFASGLRNPIGMDWQPDRALWVAVNERDESATISFRTT